MTATQTAGSALARIDLFKGIHQKELARLEGRARARTYAAGEVIVEQGSAGIALFVIRRRPRSPSACWIRSASAS